MRLKSYLLEGLVLLLAVATAEIFLRMGGDPYQATVAHAHASLPAAYTDAITFLDKTNDYAIPPTPEEPQLELNRVLPKGYRVTIIEQHIHGWDFVDLITPPGKDDRYREYGLIADSDLKPAR